MLSTQKALEFCVREKPSLRGNLYQQKIVANREISPSTIDIVQFTREGKNNLARVNRDTLTGAAGIAEQLDVITRTALR